MTTPTSKHVTRVTLRDKPVKRTVSGHCGKPRKLIITIMGDTLYLRPQGLRTGLYVDIWDTYYRAQRANDQSIKAQKLNFKKRSKK